VPPPGPRLQRCFLHATENSSPLESHEQATPVLNLPHNAVRLSPPGGEECRDMRRITTPPGKRPDFLPFTEVGTASRIFLRNPESRIAGYKYTYRFTPPGCDGKERNPDTGMYL